MVSEEDVPGDIPEAHLLALVVLEPSNIGGFHHLRLAMGHFVRNFRHGESLAYQVEALISLPADSATIARAILLAGDDFRIGSR